jgi:hypothetical protein
MTQAHLPYPIGINLIVFKDDGNWDKYRAWFLRTQKQIETLFVAWITLGHYEGSDEPDYDYESWCRKSEQLVTQYPGCIFVYGSNG